MHRLKIFYNSSWTYFILLVISFGAMALAISAYAPADGADAWDYYLHAAYLSGVDVPATFEAHPPVYPLLLYGTVYQLNNVDMLLLLQLVFGLLLPLLFYEAMRHVDALFAFGAAIVIALDMQTRVLFNFVSTEPLYVFLLACCFLMLMLLIHDGNDQPSLWGIIVLAILIMLTGFTRSVGSYLILPFAIVFALKNRTWRVLVLVIVWYVAVQGFVLTYKTAFQIERVRANTESNSLFMQPLTRSGLLMPENGDASQQIIAILDDCPESFAPSGCVVDAVGDYTAGQALIRDAYIEMVTNHPLGYVRDVFANVTDFLRTLGTQRTGESPALAQCADISTRVNNNFEQYINNDTLIVADSVTINPVALRDELLSIAQRMCPPPAESIEARAWVDALAWRYRSFARPRPWLWYGLLAFMIIMWNRQYWYLGLSALLLAGYHAGISAALYNIQPRYAVIINPYRTILVGLLIYLILRQIVLLFWLPPENDADSAPNQS